MILELNLKVNMIVKSAKCLKFSSLLRYLNTREVPYLTYLISLVVKFSRVQLDV